MSVNYGKLGLYLPGGGSSSIGGADETADIDKLNQNFQKISDNFGLVVCTSSTRPATPFVGQPIYETNTHQTLIWSGSAWLVVGVPMYVQASEPDASAPENSLWFW